VTQPIIDDRLRLAIQDMVEAYVDVRMRYYRPWLYQVLSVTPGPPVKMDLKSTVPTQMPDLTGITLWPGPDGAWSTPPVGATVTVTFANGDSTNPRISWTDPNNQPTTTTSKASIESDIFAPIVKIGDATARFLAHALEVGNDMTAISTLISALSVYVGAIESIADPVPPHTVTTTLQAACTAATAAIAAQAATLPTIMAEGT
jgi:hypothetical protein